MKLQYQLSNGAWFDCGDRTPEFLAMCVKFGGYADESEVLAALAAGKEVRNDTGDWYDFCRDADALVSRTNPPADNRPVIRCKSCGATGHSGAYPFSTLPGSSICDDCV